MIPMPAGGQDQARDHRAAHRRILGVDFFTGTVEEAVAIGMRGGLVVVPAAPALVELPRDEAYRQAVQSADLAITDSGLMVLLWWVFERERLTRVSGLAYLRRLLSAPELRQGEGLFWILPTPAAQARTVAWLRAEGFHCPDDYCYVAPQYERGSISDPVLLARLRAVRPAQIVIGLGGGTQERLGLLLKNELAYRPGIHCIGAAIGFLTGDQVGIPAWADRWVLGWLFRCMSEPRKFVPRYWRATQLVGLLWRYRDRLPEPVLDARKA